MKIGVKALAFLLVISVIAGQSQQVFLFAGSSSEIGSNPSSWQYQPVIPISSSIPTVQPLSTSQSGMLAIGTEETIRNIVSFSPRASDQDTISEHAQESAELLHYFTSSSNAANQNGAISSEPVKGKSSEIATGSEKQNRALMAEPFSYERALLGTRNKDKKDNKKTTSDDTIDFFSGPALSEGQLNEDDRPSLEKALRAIFNQKLENLYVGSELNRLPENAYNQPDEKGEIEGSDYVVVDVVNFTRDIRLIHQLLNPPERLHPWLKWLLYLGRVTPQMLEIYYGALQKRDQIFKLAFDSAVNGDKKYKIRYRGKIMKEFPVYVMPEDAQGFYELVRMSDDGGNAMTAQGSTGSQP